MHDSGGAEGNGGQEIWFRTAQGKDVSSGLSPLAISSRGACEKQRQWTVSRSLQALPCAHARNADVLLLPPI